MRKSFTSKLVALSVLVATATPLSGTASLAAEAPLPASSNLQNETPHEELERTDVVISKQKDKEIADAYAEDSPFALVSLRFPAEYGPNFLRNLNRLSNFRHDTLATLRAFVNEQILKSAYSATEFYDYLDARLPADSVILEPMKISFDPAGKVICVPIRKAVPALITVDLMAGISANRVRTPFAGTKGDDTFGSNVSMYAQISKQGKAGSMPLAASLMLDDKNIPFNVTAESFYNIVCDGTKVKALPSKSTAPAAVTSFVQLPASYKCETKTIIEPERLVDGEGDVPNMQFWTAYGNVIINAIKKEDLEAAKPHLMATYIDDLDPEIGELLERGYNPDNGSALNQRKIDVLSRYMENERKQIFSVVSQRTEESLYSGELGDSMRAMAKSELEFTKKKSSSKRRQYAADVIGVAAGAGSLVAALTLPTPAFSNMLTTASFASFGLAQNESRVQQKLREVFQQFHRQADDIQTSFLLKFGNDALEVTGKDIDDLRTKFRTKYQEQFEAYNLTKGSNL